MALPILLAAAGGGLGLAEGLFNLDAAKKRAQAMVQKAQFDKDQASKQGQFLMFNARVAERQGERDVKMINRAADFNRGRIEKERRQVAGAQQAQFAASGVDASFGSAAQVRTESDIAAGLDAIEVSYMAELDSITTKNNAWRQAYGFKLEAAALREQAEFNLAGAKATGAAGVDQATIGAFLSLLKGGMQGASMGAGMVAGTPSGGMTVPSTAPSASAYYVPKGGVGSGSFGGPRRF